MSNGIFTILGQPFHVTIFFKNSLSLTPLNQKTSNNKQQRHQNTNDDKSFRIDKISAATRLNGFT